MAFLPQQFIYRAVPLVWLEPQTSSQMELGRLHLGRQTRTAILAEGPTSLLPVVTKDRSRVVGGSYRELQPVSTQERARGSQVAAPGGGCHRRRPVEAGAHSVCPL